MKYSSFEKIDELCEQKIHILFYMQLSRTDWIAKLFLTVIWDEKLDIELMNIRAFCFLFLKVLHSSKVSTGYLFYCEQRSKYLPKHLAPTWTILFIFTLLYLFPNTWILYVKPIITRVDHLPQISWFTRI